MTAVDRDLTGVTATDLYRVLGRRLGMNPDTLTTRATRLGQLGVFDRPGSGGRRNWTVHDLTVLAVDYLLFGNRRGTPVLRSGTRAVLLAAVAAGDYREVRITDDGIVPVGRPHPPVCLLVDPDAVYRSYVVPVLDALDTTDP